MEQFIDGKICFIDAVKTVKENFITRTFGLDLTEIINGTPYENYAQMQTTNDKTKLLDNLQLGDRVRCHFGIKGTKKAKDQHPITDLNPSGEQIFTNLSCWRIEFINEQGQVIPAPQRGGQQTQGQQQQGQQQNQQGSEGAAPSKDDLPF